MIMARFAAKTTGFWDSAAVLDTTARDEPAVQVLRTTGLWGSEAVLDTTVSDEPAVQVLKTTGLPVGCDAAVLKTTAGG